MGTRTRRSSRSLPRSPRRRRTSRTRTTPTTTRKRVMTTTIPPERRPSFRQPLVELFLRGLAELSRSAPQLSYAQPAAQPATQSVLLLLGDLRRRRRTSTLCGDFYSVFLKNPSLIVNEERRSAF